MSADQLCFVSLVILRQLTHLNTRDSDILEGRLFQYFSQFHEVLVQLHLADAYTLLINVSECNMMPPKAG